MKKLREDVIAQLKVVDLSFEQFIITFEQSILEINQIECVKIERIQSSINGVVSDLLSFFKEIVPKSAKIEEEKSSF